MTAFAEPRNSLGSMCNPERRSSRYLSNAPSRNCSCIAAAPKDSFCGDIVTGAKSPAKAKIRRAGAEKRAWTRRSARGGWR